MAGDRPDDPIRIGPAVVKAAPGDRVEWLTPYGTWQPAAVLGTELRVHIRLDNGTVVGAWPDNLRAL